MKTIDKKTSQLLTANIAAVNSKMRNIAERIHNEAVKKDVFTAGKLDRKKLKAKTEKFLQDKELEKKVGKS